MKTIRGKRAMVTGAAAGIGRAIALRLAQEGANLFLVDIDMEKLGAVADEIKACGVEVIVRCCDLSDAAQISATVAELRRSWPQLDLLINNAGIAYYGPTHLMTAEQWKQVIAVNLLAPIQLVRELLPMLLSADDSHLLNVCSMFALVPWRRIAAYQASKFGLLGFTLSLRAEYYNESFGVTALCPGFARSALLEACSMPDAYEPLRVPAWLCTTPERVAAGAVRAIRKKQGLVVMTPAAHFYWRLTRLLPGLVDWLNRQGWRRRKKIKV
jgi:short-subunit dehydrogenase